MSFIERCKKFNTAVEKAEKDLQLKRLPRIVFPRHQKTPRVARYAMKILEWYGAVYVEELNDVKPKNTNHGKRTKTTKRTIRR